MRVVFAAIVICLASSAHAAGPDMKDGLWEITVKMDMPGMPATMPPQTIRQCITRRDLDDLRKMTPSAAMGDARCEMSDYKVQENTARWNWRCKGEEAASGSTTLTFSRNAYSGTNQMSMKPRGGPAQNMTMHYTGKYLGPCQQ